MFLFALPIMLLIYFLYKISGKYDRDMQEKKFLEEIEKRDKKENENLERYINILENENKKIN